MQGIAIGVVLLEFIAEKSELVGPRSRIFPSDDSVDQSGAGRQALLREFGNNAPRELRPRIVGEPGNEARAGFAQIAKNRRVALAPIFDPDKTSLVELDQPIFLGISASWLIRIEPIDLWNSLFAAVVQFGYPDPPNSEGEFCPDHKFHTAPCEMAGSRRRCRKQAG